MALVACLLFSTVAFAGAGYLFQHLNKSGYESGMKRHNKAIEDMTAAKETFYEQETHRRDKKEAALRQKIQDARYGDKVSLKALETLKSELGQYSTERRPPQLSDFYQPPDEMAGYKYLVMGTMCLGIS